MSDVGTIVSLLAACLIGLRGVHVVLGVPLPSASPKSATAPAPPSMLATTRPQPLLVEEPASVTEHTTNHLDSAFEAEGEGPRDTQPGLQHQ